MAEEGAVEQPSAGRAGGVEPSTINLRRNWRHAGGPTQAMPRPRLSSTGSAPAAGPGLGSAPCSRPPPGHRSPPGRAAASAGWRRHTAVRAARPGPPITSTRFDGRGAQRRECKEGLVVVPLLELGPSPTTVPSTAPCVATRSPKSVTAL